jgi:Tol biopolymer transport system component
MRSRGPPHPSGPCAPTAAGSDALSVASVRAVPRRQAARFAAPTEGSDGDLFVIDANGGEQSLLLATQKPKQPAAWSPDGSKILFTAFDRYDAGADVFVMDADGTNVRRLTQAGATNIAAAWSPDGSKILFTRGPPGNAELLLMDGDGTHERTISTDRFRGYEPSWR